MLAGASIECRFVCFRGARGLAPEMRCCNCRVIAYDCDMSNSNHTEAIARLSESEGVFTTA